jgi:hypothetical protein
MTGRETRQNKRLGMIQGAARFYILIETLSEFKPLKFLNNEFAAGKLNIDYGRGVCQEPNSKVAHYWIYPFSKVSSYCFC